MIKPLNKKLVVQLIEKETVTAGGIILTRADPNEANRGKVVSIGSEVLDISVGDVILPNWNKATKTKVGEETFYIVVEEDVVLIFEE
jgi:chaperonin GroES